MITDERKQYLDTAYQANIANGNAPYWHVTIQDCDDLAHIIEGRHYTGADLRGADLRGADLRGADLRGADLTDADLTDAALTRADLTDADLTDADLTRADLRGADLTRAALTRADLTRAALTRADLTRAALTDADLTRADLRGAALTRADLRGADLTDADLTDAALRGADLTRADLTRADLTLIQQDIYAVVDHAPLDLVHMIRALRDGKVDGSTYNDNCGMGCLVGTLEIGAMARLHVEYTWEDGMPDIPRNPDRPAERWFLAIRPGMTPETSPIVAWTVGILEERLAFYQRLAAIWPRNEAGDADEAINVQVAREEREEYQRLEYEREVRERHEDD